MKKLLYATLAFAPSLALAQGSPDLNNLQVLLGSISRLVSAALPIVVGLALLAFFWGLMKFIFAAGNEESKAEGKSIMIYGIIALFVMVAVWGLVGFIAGSLGVQTGGQVTGGIPSVPGL
ncbi:MAG: pilin [Patescibacteria group bacterium]